MTYASIPFARMLLPDDIMVPCTAEVMAVRLRNMPRKSYPSFRCPECQKRVILRSGPVRKPHFSHVHLSECEVRNWSAETVQHRMAKERLAERISSSKSGRLVISWPGHARVFSLALSDVTADVECPIESIHWIWKGFRADVVVMYKGRIVFIIEIFETHSTEDWKRPQPWVECRASDVTCALEEEGDVCLSDVRPHPPSDPGSTGGVLSMGREMLLHKDMSGIQNLFWKCRSCDDVVVLRELANHCLESWIKAARMMCTPAVITAWRRRMALECARVLVKGMGRLSLEPGVIDDFELKALDSLSSRYGSDNVANAMEHIRNVTKRRREEILKVDARRKAERFLESMKSRKSDPKAFPSLEESARVQLSDSPDCAAHKRATTPFVLKDHTSRSEPKRRRLRSKLHPQSEDVNGQLRIFDTNLNQWVEKKKKKTLDDFWSVR